MFYVVCTRCTFLRAFARDASPDAVPARCPVCDSEVMIHGTADRFQPTYVGRVSLDLHATPALDQGSEK